MSFVQSSSEFVSFPPVIEKILFERFSFVGKLILEYKDFPLPFIKELEEKTKKRSKILFYEKMKWDDRKADELIYVKYFNDPENLKYCSLRTFYGGGSEWFRNGRRVMSLLIGKQRYQWEICNRCKEWNYIPDHSKVCPV